MEPPSTKESTPFVGARKTLCPARTLWQKATDLMTPVLGAKAFAALIEKRVSLENVKNILELRPLLQRT